MPLTTFLNRRAASIETGTHRVTVLAGGGHVAEILDKSTGVNPLWTPPWPGIDPSDCPVKNSAYGSDVEARMLAGVMGHSLCMDIYGDPSVEEIAAGLTLHGEASVVAYQLSAESRTLVSRANLPLAQLSIERVVRLQPDSPVIRFSETVENLAGTDRPIAWTEHVTLGPPYLEKGVTRFSVTATRSKTFEGEFGDTYQMDTEFEWPHAPRQGGGTIDLRTFSSAASSAGLTTHLMDPQRSQAYFVAWSPRSKLAFGYVWNRPDFPWLAIWEENYSRQNPPWCGKTLARGMEFGVSPMPQTRRRMIDRQPLFGVPGYRWIPARSRVPVDYCAFLMQADQLPNDVAWDGAWQVKFN